ASSASPLPPPHLQQLPGHSGIQMKSCLNPAMTPGEFHTNVSPRPTSPLPPNNREQPSSPSKLSSRSHHHSYTTTPLLCKKPPLWSSPSDSQHIPTNKLRPNPNPHIDPGPLVLALGTVDQQNVPQTPSSACTSPKANTTNKPPPSDPCVDSGTAHFFPNEGTTDPQKEQPTEQAPKHLR
ncbi:hypothetical protein C0989_007384, partial [Termitomyces sp. Mn162]